MNSWYENINSIGDLVSTFIIKLYGRENTQFSADAVYLNSHWLTSILKEKFGIEKLNKCLENNVLILYYTETGYNIFLNNKVYHNTQELINYIINQYGTIS